MPAPHSSPRPKGTPFKALFLLVPVFLAALGSCTKGLTGDEPYRRIGHFPNRVQAERMALRHIAERYESLPRTGEYRVLFSYDTTATRTVNNAHALWYNRQTSVLSVEHDIGSGHSCQWREVTQAVLDQLVAANRGLVRADSLAQPTGLGYSRCY
jgi:hypothetical protein